MTDSHLTTTCDGRRPHSPSERLSLPLAFVHQLLSPRAPARIVPHRRRDPRLRGARLDVRRREARPGEHRQEGPRRPQRSEDAGRTHAGPKTGEHQNTGQEEDTDLGIVNMNGRLYDPVIGQFLQADPVVTEPVSQGLNRYAYVNNSPLNATDPTGFAASSNCPGGFEQCAGPFPYDDNGWPGYVGTALVYAPLAAGAAYALGSTGGGNPFAGGTAVGAGSAANDSARPAGGNPLIESARRGGEAVALYVAVKNTPSKGTVIGRTPAAASTKLRRQPQQSAGGQAYTSSNPMAPSTEASKKSPVYDNSSVPNQAFAPRARGPGIVEESFKGDPKDGQFWDAVGSGMNDVAWTVGPLGAEKLAIGVIRGIGKRVAGGAAQRLAVTFGRNANQIEHAFRHTDKLGLSRTAVQEAIQKHLPSVIDKIPSGSPLNRVIEVGGKRIQYSAFRLPDGSINVGRIHGVP